MNACQLSGRVTPPFPDFQVPEKALAWANFWASPVLCSDRRQLLRDFGVLLQDLLQPLSGHGLYLQMRNVVCKETNRIDSREWYGMLLQCVCVYVYIYIYVYTVRTCVCVCVSHLFLCLCPSPCVSVSVRLSGCLCLPVCPSARLSACLSVRPSVRLSVCIVCVFVCMHVGTLVRTYVRASCVYTCIHVRTIYMHVYNLRGSAFADIYVCLGVSFFATNLDK